MRNLKSILFTISFILSFSNIGITQSENSSPDSLFLQKISSTKSIYFPSAYGLKKREGYYQNIMLFFHQFHYGITDNFSLGLGFELLNVAIQLGSNLYEKGSLPIIISVTPKYSEPINNKLNVGLGSWLVHIPWQDESISLGVLYGLISHGTKVDNFTFGIGHGRFEKRWSSIPSINFGFNLKPSRRFGISGEIWLVENYEKVYGAYYMGSFRYFGKKVTLDFNFYRERRIKVLARISPLNKCGIFNW